MKISVPFKYRAIFTQQLRISVVLTLLVIGAGQHLYIYATHTHILFHPKVPGNFLIIGAKKAFSCINNSAWKFTACTIIFIFVKFFAIIIQYLCLISNSLMPSSLSALIPISTKYSPHVYFIWMSIVLPERNFVPLLLLLKIFPILNTWNLCRHSLFDHASTLLARVELSSLLIG